MVVWGPTASITVKAPALGGVVDKSWVLVDMRASAREIADIKQCFDDVSFIYALGNDQAKCVMSLTFLIFISKCGQDQTGNITSGFESYKQRRIFASPDGEDFSVGNFTRHGWPVGLEIGPVDLKRQACYGTIHYLTEL